MARLRTSHRIALLLAPALETRVLSDDEIHAGWMYLQTLPEKR